MIIIFMKKLWFVNSTLVQCEREGGEGSLTKIFYANMFPSKFCSLGEFHAKPSMAFGVISKKPPGGRADVYPLKNNSAKINKTLDAHGGPRIFKHFKFLLMHSWMLCPPHLVPDIEYFARINQIIFNLEQKFANKFPRDCLQ